MSRSLIIFVEEQIPMQEVFDFIVDDLKGYMIRPKEAVLENGKGTI